MPVGAGGWVGTYIYGKRLLDALFLTNQNFATSNSVKDKATVDAYGYVLQTYCACAYRVVPDGYGVLYGLYICISAWASALLVSTEWAMRRP